LGEERVSGILLHPTSLPGPAGIGELGAGARAFVDFLSAAGQRRWQLLPLVPTGMGDSPYSSCSTFAGNPLLISAGDLMEEGLLERSECPRPASGDESVTDYAWAARAKGEVVDHALRHFERRPPGDMASAYATFLKSAQSWLDDYALFVALKAHHGGAPWFAWEDDLRDRHPATMSRWRARLAREIEAVRLGQFLFFHQWRRVRDYAHERGVRTIGDLPIFVTLDSADVWAHRHLFKLDPQGRPEVVAGVPPDYFSATGQLWGNPLYRWEAHSGSGFAWWVERVGAALEVADEVRLDHFRGFSACWEVPADATDAIGGKWMPGPGLALFQALDRALPEGASGRIIAEDLGVITPDVEQLRCDAGLPGMAVLQFAFDSGAENPHLPEHHQVNQVVYTGTHDNDTTVGWFQAAPEPVRDFARRYLRSDGAEIHWDLMDAAMASVAATAIVPLQDVLGLNGRARMNRPGLAHGNWCWRVTAGQLAEAPVERLRGLLERHRRLV